MVLRSIVRAVARLVAGEKCSLCGRRVLDDEADWYNVGPGTAYRACTRCLSRPEVLRRSLAALFYVDPVAGPVTGATHYCPRCRDRTMWRFVFEEEFSRPVAAKCSSCGYTVRL